MKQKVYFWIENYLFNPNFFQQIISFILLPLTFFYYMIVFIKRKLAIKENFDIPIISIGNLIVGGSGKTPFALYLANKIDNLAIVLRGYKRDSTGLLIVSKNGKILTDVKQSGDEAMLLASQSKNSTVIVSEERKIAINKAKTTYPKQCQNHELFHHSFFMG